MSNCDDDVTTAFVKVIPILWTILLGLLLGGLACIGPFVALIVGVVMLIPVLWFYGWGPPSNNATERMLCILLVVVPWIGTCCGLTIWRDHPFLGSLLGAVFSGVLIQVLFWRTDFQCFKKKPAEDFSLPMIAVDLRSDTEKQMERDARSEKSLGVEADKLVAELIVIGRSKDFISSKGSRNEYDSNSRHIRTRQIGQELEKLGGMDMMQVAYYRVIHAIGARRDFDYAWNGVGGWMA